MTVRVNARVALAVGAALLLTPESASAITVFDAVTSTISLDAAGEVYARVRHRKVGDEAFETPFDLSRARLKLKFRYGPWLRADLEPDFGGDQADIADVFLQIAPVREIDVRIGQAKVPFGMLETESRWRLPTLRRGMINNVVFDRIGFSVRQLGARVRVRLKEAALRPRFELGVYGDPDQTFTDHAAARVRLRLMKRTHVALEGYTIARAAVNDGRGYAGAVSVLSTRKRLYAGVEFFMGRARLLAATGLDPGVDATFMAARGIGAYEFRPAEDFEIQPYLALELYEPNLSTRDDLSYSGRAGVNVKWLKRLRLGVEADYQAGQSGAVVVDQFIITGFAGVRLE